MSENETPEARLRRMRLRSWRRGIREMDLILGRYSDAGLTGLAPDILEAFDALLSEHDHDLYHWIAGSAAVPRRYEEIIARIRAHHGMA